MFPQQDPEVYEVYEDIMPIVKRTLTDANHPEPFVEACWNYFNITTPEDRIDFLRGLIQQYDSQPSPGPDYDRFLQKMKEFYQRLTQPPPPPQPIIQQPPPPREPPRRDPNNPMWRSTHSSPYRREWARRRREQEEIIRRRTEERRQRQGQ